MPIFNAQEQGEHTSLPFHVAHPHGKAKAVGESSRSGNKSAAKWLEEETGKVGRSKQIK